MERVKLASNRNHSGISRTGVLQRLSVVPPRRAAYRVSTSRANEMSRSACVKADPKLCADIRKKP